MLSHHDQNALDTIARQLEESDPALAAALRDGRVSSLPSMKTFLLAVLGLFGVLLVVLGIVAASITVLMTGLVALSAAGVVSGVRRMATSGTRVTGRARPPV